MIRNLIFDWSGTLADDLGPVLEATNLIFTHYNRAPMSLDEFREKFRLPFSEFYDELLPEVPALELEEHYRRHFPPLQASIALLPHALEMLEFARTTGRRVFLLSTIQEDHFQEQAGRLGVLPYFEHPYVRVMDKRVKIGEILKERGLIPAETMFVGDMLHDIETARHGGVMSVAVLTGFDRAEKLLTAGPDLIVRDLSVLRTVLEAEPAPGRRPVCTVGALIFNRDGRFLLMQTHKWNNTWGIPGGKIQPDEPAMDALHREILEETGLRISGAELVMVQDSINSPEFMRPEHFVLLNYRAVTEDTHVVLNDEAERFEWLTMEEAKLLPLNTPTRALLEKLAPALR